LIALEWARFLPDKFEFYHLGEVQASSDPISREVRIAESFTDCIGAAFLIRDRATSDTLAWLVLVFDQGLDAATYTELGNVIASRFAGNLARDLQLIEGALPSPPRTLNAPQLSRLFSMNSSREQEARVYHPARQGTLVPVRAYVLSSPTEGAKFDV
jgi:hypothetical protein